MTRRSILPSAPISFSSSAFVAATCAGRSAIDWLPLVSRTSATVSFRVRGPRARRRVGKRKRHERETERAQPRARPPRPDSEADREQACSSMSASSQTGARGEGEDQALNSMPQPVQQVAYVHLVGLVIAGQRIHHEIDAAARRASSRCRLPPGVSG